MAESVKSVLWGRAVGRSENPGVPVVMWGYNLSPLVEIALIDVSKSRGAMASPAPPGTTDLRGSVEDMLVGLLWVRLGVCRKIWEDLGP